MTAFASTYDPTPDEQAALWAARLDGSSLTATDQAALESWLAESPAHRALLSRYCQLSADLEQQLPALAATGGVTMPAAPAAPTTRRWIHWGIGVGLGAAAAAALVLRFALPATQSENLATPIGQRRALTLADGSRVELNAQTSLRIDIDRKERRARLASGEAFFAVQKDPARPFVVETPAGSVRVTGTQFDVRVDTSALEVTVVEGQVQAHPGEAGARSGLPVSLAAGDRLSAGAGSVNVRALSAAELDDALAWRQGQIVFKGVPLREALARFARYHGRTISVSAGAARFPVGGRYSLDDLNGFLASMEEIFPVRVAHNLNGTVQVSLRDEP